MLFRTVDNNLIEIKRDNFLTDKEYYDKIYLLKLIIIKNK